LACVGVTSFISTPGARVARLVSGVTVIPTTRCRFGRPVRSLVAALARNEIAKVLSSEVC